MRYIVALSAFIILSINLLFSQQSEIEKEMRREYEGLSVDEIKKELNKAISDIKIQDITVFNNKEKVNKLLAEAENMGPGHHVYNIAPYKEMSVADIRKFMFEIFKDNAFTQSLINVDVSFISPIGSYINSILPYYSNDHSPVFTARKIYFTDGTSEDCKYKIDGRIPTGKLISKMDIDIDYESYANVTKIGLSENKDYTNGNNFARLVDIDGNEVKLWVSEDIYNNGSFAITTQSGKIIHTSHNPYSKIVTGTSSTAVDRATELRNGLIKIHTDIENGKYQTSEKLIQDIVKIVPEYYFENKITQYALSITIITTEDDPIDKIDLMQQEGTNYIHESMTIPNADIMPERIGVRRLGETLIDNSGNVLAEFPSFYRIDNGLGLFFGVKKEEYSDWALYLFDRNTKEMKETPYSNYTSGLGRVKNYDYDFILVNDNETSKYGVSDLNGKIVIPTLYSDIEYEPFDQLFLVKETELNNDDPLDYSMGVVDADNKEILKKEYRSIYMGKYFITTSDKDEKKIFDKKGNPLLKEGWSATPAHPILFKPPVLFDDSNNRVEGNELDEPLLLVSRLSGTNQTSFFINNKGEIILNETNEYKFYDYFHEGMAAVKKENTPEGKEKYGYIDYKGNIVIPMVYDEVNSFINGYAEVEKNSKTFYIDKSNQPVDRSIVEKSQVDGIDVMPAIISGESVEM